MNSQACFPGALLIVCVLLSHVFIFIHPFRSVTIFAIGRPRCYDHNISYNDNSPNGLDRKEEKEMGQSTVPSTGWN